MNRLVVSTDGRWLAASVVSGRVCVWPLAAGGAATDAGECRPVMVPAVEGGVTALRFKPPPGEVGGGLDGGGQGKRAGGCQALVLVSATNQVAGRGVAGALGLVISGTLGVLGRLPCRACCGTRVSHTRLGVVAI